MPDKPVAVGESWTSEMALPMAVVGKMTAKGTCKLVKLTPKASDQVATIDTKIESSSAKGQKLGDKSASVSLDAMTLNGTGRMKMMVNSGLIFEQTLDMKGSTTMTYSGPEGDRKITSKFDIQSTVTITRVKEAKEKKGTTD